MLLLPNRSVRPSFRSEWLKPTEICEIDWRAPVTKGLASYVLFGAPEVGSNSLRDLVTQRTFTFASGTNRPSWQSTDLGFAMSSTGEPTNTYASTTWNPLTVPITSGWTFAVTCQFSSFNSGDTTATLPLVLDGGGAFIALGSQNAGTTPQLLYFVSPDGSASGQAFASETTTANRWYTIFGVSRSRTVHELWFDGVLKTTNNWDSGASSSLSTTYNFSHSTEGHNGPILWAAIWNRALAEDEIKSISDRPFNHLRSRYNVRVAGSGLPVNSTVTKTATVDAALSASRTKTASFDAVFRASPTVTATADANLQASQTKTATVDSYVLNSTRGTKSTTADALLGTKNATTAAIDSYLIRVDFASGNRYITLPARPRVFTVPNRYTS